ncbi:MAG: hypothetical protein RLZZ293_1282 [Pseudomonadota bacterium]|jgi:hypothetical protein
MVNLFLIGKYKMKLLSITIILFSLASTALALDNGQEYVDNNGTTPIYAQFLWRDKGSCEDSKGSSLYEVAPNNTVTDSIMRGVDSTSSDCHATMNVYSDSAGKNLIAQEYLTWDGAGENVISHDTPPRICTLSYTCDTNLTDNANHLHLEIDNSRIHKYVTIKTQTTSDYTSNVYVQYKHLSGTYCSDSLNADFFKINKDSSVTDGILNLGNWDWCTYNINISTDSAGKNEICWVEGFITDDDVVTVAQLNSSNNAKCKTAISSDGISGTITIMP